MRRRVAAIATLLTFVLITLFVGIGTYSSIQRRDKQTTEKLVMACRMTSAMVDHAAFQEETEDFLSSVAQQAGINVSMYDEQGTLIFRTRKKIDAIAEDDNTAALADVLVVRRTPRNSRENLIYAIHTLDDGRMLYVSAEACNIGILYKNAAWLYVAGIVLLLVIEYCIVWSTVGRADTAIASVMSVLEDISEGKYDSRVVEMPDGTDRKLTAHYNAIISRVQDRVFQQQTRNQALSQVMMQMQNGILAVDDQLHITLITPNAKQLLGITGSPEGIALSKASNDVELDTIFEEAMKQPGVYMNEVPARTGAGRSKRPLRMYVSAMRSDGRVVGALAMIEDVTEIKRLEQVRTDFAANVSHEMKTPLTSIKGFVETLQAGAINNPEMANKFLNIISLEADRLTRLINDILSISKLESGDDKVETERLMLDKMACDVSDFLRIHAGEKDVTIHCKMCDPHAEIIGNPDRVKQMLINLIENAIKYNKNGGSVRVSVFENGDNVNLSVADTGIGIPEEHLPRLFERFYRVDKGRSRSMGGTGLGLAIVKHIVNTMNGMIEVHSKFGEGTEFLITLPKAPPKTEAELAEEKRINEEDYMI